MKALVCDLKKTTVEELLKSVELEIGDVINFINIDNSEAVLNFETFTINEEFFTLNDPDELTEE